MAWRRGPREHAALCVAGSKQSCYYSLVLAPEDHPSSSTAGGAFSWKLCGSRRERVRSFVLQLRGEVEGRMEEAGERRWWEFWGQEEL